jgi:hypothetical protein
VNAADIRPGAIYHIGRGCGVPWEWAPIRLTVSHAVPLDGYAGTAHLEGYELDQHGRAVDYRNAVYVKTAGMRLIASPAQPATRLLRGANERPYIPAPRTSPETTGRTR